MQNSSKNQEKNLSFCLHYIIVYFCYLKYRIEWTAGLFTQTHRVMLALKMRMMTQVNRREVCV